MGIKQKLIPLIIFLFPMITICQTLGEIFIESVEVDDEKNDWFLPEEKGWLAGDVGHSIPIGHHKIVWLFGDSFFGEYANGKQQSDGMHINNCIAIQDLTKPIGKQFTFYMGANEPTRAIFPPQSDMPGSFFWPTNGFFLENRLFLFCQSMDIDDTGFWTMVGTVIIEIDNPMDEPIFWNKQYYNFGTPPWDGDNFQQQFHSAIFLEDTFIYFMGFTLKDRMKKTILAKMEKEDFMQHKNAKYLEYYVEFNGKAEWSNSKNDLKYLFSPGNTESNIQYINEWDIFVTTTYLALDQNIMLTTAKSIEGPWTTPVTIYKNPLEVCPSETCIETYAVRPHPEFSTETGELIISFISSFRGKFENIPLRAYRPNFIKVQLKKYE